MKALANKVSNERDAAVIYFVRPIVNAGCGTRTAEDVFGDVQEVRCWRRREGGTTVSSGKVLVEDRGSRATEGRVRGPDVLATIPEHAIACAGASNDCAIGASEAG